jgi:hypothetical protein
VIRKLSNTPPITSITSEGGIYLIILAFISVGSVLRNVNLLILMSGMMIAPLLINWRLGVLRSRTLSAKRSLPYRVHAKQVSSLQWLCFNHSSFSAWGIEIYDSLDRQTTGQFSDDSFDQDHGKGTQNIIPGGSYSRRLTSSFLEAAFGRDLVPSYNVRMQLATIAGQQQEVATSRLYFPERGAYHFGPAQMVTRFPFGLIETRIPIDTTEVLYVAPQLGKLTPVWDRRVRSVITGSDALLKRRGLAGDDFYALRRWRSGDSQKLIHWRTSAKYGYPIVKQFEQPDNRDFAMLLDLFQPPEEDPEYEAATQRCETALSFATTVLLNMGSAVQGRTGLAICGERTTNLQTRSIREMIENAMRVMATVRPTSSPELIRPMLELADSVSLSTPIYVISSRSKIDLFPTVSANEPGQLNQLRNIWPSVVWLEVDSLEFNELFQLPGDQEELRSLAAKWSEHVPN